MARLDRLPGLPRRRLHRLCLPGRSGTDPRHVVMSNQLPVLDLRVVHGAARRLGNVSPGPNCHVSSPFSTLIIGIGWACATGRGTCPRGGRRPASLQESRSGDWGSGAGEVPSSDERVLLSRSDDISRGQHSDDDGELRAMSASPLAGPGLRPSAQDYRGSCGRVN